MAKTAHTMDNKVFNDYMVEWAAQRMVAQGYELSVEEAKAWLAHRKTKPTFEGDRWAVRTLERLCEHAYTILVARRRGQEIELPTRVKVYYTPHFKNLEAGKPFYASMEE